MTRWEEFIFGLILSTFVLGIAVPLILPKFSGAIVQTRLSILKKRSVFAITSILSSQVCCQIAANAYMAREPDKKQKQIKSLSHFNIKSKYCSWGFVTIGFEHWMLCTSGHWCINMTVNQIKNGGNQTQQSRDSLIDAIVLVVSMILVSVTWHIQHL